ncbi:I78 family peptidase inhibitor [Sphingomonas sp. PR090111-T3T-6A]|uniref:I78 family peptidase inhibitor n=1 Tax=Sphingomonas sp. PR090111-T3T-6A TaxID=685778 RepID=UPI000377771D|nr:I78 family peptidase inhibitor [Sphingomonas sp. PR090111-T3T-6A]
MRNKPALLLATLALAGCTPVEMRGEHHPAAGERVCRNEPAQRYLGHGSGTGAIEGARRASGAKTVRVVRPGEAVTMDFRPDRLTVTVDKHQVISRLNCG